MVFLFCFGFLVFSWFVCWLGLPRVGESISAHTEPTKKPRKTKKTKKTYFLHKGGSLYVVVMGWFGVGEIGASAPDRPSRHLRIEKEFLIRNKDIKIPFSENQFSWFSLFFLVFLVFHGFSIVLVCRECSLPTPSQQRNHEQI